MSRRCLLLVLAGALPSACIPSNVVAEQDRAVATPAKALRWDAPPPATLDGLYESVAISGEVAHAMQKVYYWFAGDGEFSGAALVSTGGTLQFQTLSGRYRIAVDRVWLGDGNEPATLAAAEDHLRFTSADGTLVLRRVGD